MAPGGGVPPCDRVCSRPLESNTLCDDASMSAHFEDLIKQRLTHFLLYSLCRTRTLNAVATLDNICLQAYRPRSAVEFEEQATGIAEDRANLVSSPEGSRRGGAVLARRLRGFAIVSSHCCHIDEGWGVSCYRRDCAIRECEMKKSEMRRVGQPKRATCAGAIRYDRGKRLKVITGETEVKTQNKKYENGQNRLEDGENCKYVPVNCFGLLLW
jgi:hypothetical protein